MSKKPTFKQKLKYHDFKPTLSIWFNKDSGKSRTSTYKSQVVHGGKGFTTCRLFILQLGFTCVYIKFRWWHFEPSKTDGYYGS